MVAKVLLLFGLSWLTMLAAQVPLVRQGCQPNCGNISIPYPFGIGQGCFREGFEVHCDANNGATTETAVLTLAEIHLTEGRIQVTMEATWKNFHNNRENQVSWMYWNDEGPFVVSTHNKVIAIGCNTMTNIYDELDYAYWPMQQVGCNTICSKMSDISNGSCSGHGCCEITFSNKFNEFYYNITLLNDEALQFSPCSFVIQLDPTSFTFTTSLFTELMDLCKNKDTADSNPLASIRAPKFPLSVEWWIGNSSCKEASRNNTDFACVALNSYCIDSTNKSYGYRCQCKDGYHGNPYLFDGCQDIDECAQYNPCRRCVNTPGSYYCSSPVLRIAIFSGVGTGLGSLLIIATIFFTVQKWKDKEVKRLKQKHFKSNRGLLLQQLISSDPSASDKTKIFSLEELEKATNNFDSNRIIGGGGHGTVYKGILSDQRVVAIKKANISKQSEIDQFINEVAILSQINHRNVIRLYGCCLETEVPLLVYEFIANGALSDYLHIHHRKFSLSWKDRLRIASEAAGALAYLHYAASISIFHRDVKSSNILLDDTYTARVSDFGTSRTIPFDRSRITTIVQGTFGYFDPEYVHTGQLTDKSDVYSFGVILVELLTGEKPVCSTRVEDMNLATRFLCSLENNEHFQLIESELLNEGTKEDIEEVARLAETCLRLRGVERPSMKEVQEKLEGLRRAKKQHHPSAGQGIAESASLTISGTDASYLPEITRQFSLERAIELSMSYPR